jgi:hypothetical protein
MFTRSFHCFQTELAIIVFQSEISEEWSFSVLLLYLRGEHWLGHRLDKTSWSNQKIKGTEKLEKPHRRPTYIFWYVLLVPKYPSEVRTPSATIRTNSKRKNTFKCLLWGYKSITSRIHSQAPEIEIHKRIILHWWLCVSEKGCHIHGRT